jgi:HD-like signal output (HDOD) protein
VDEIIIKSVKALPPLPKTALRVQEICADLNASIADLTKTIEKDPMLTANLLKAANSPLYGFAREIKTLGQAVSLFGFATVRGFAIAATVRGTIDPDLSPYKINAERFVDFSQLQNALMIRWYGIFDRMKLEILSPASFLFSVGRLIMANEIVRRDLVADFRKCAEEKGLEEAEEEFLKTNYQEVSAEIFTHWNFEPALIDVIRHSKDPLKAPESLASHAKALRVVQIAVEIPDGLSEKSIERAAKCAESFGLPSEAFINVAKTLNR